MHEKDSRDPLMDQSHAPMAAWENSLRPAKSSHRVWLSVGAMGLAVAAYLAFDSWRDWRHPTNPGTRQVAPAASSTVAPPSVQRNEPLQRAPESPPQRTQRIAKCTSPAGATTYSDGPCPHGTQAGEVWVRPDLNLADGMSEDARQASMRENSAVAQSVLAHERRVAMNVDSSTSECDQLNALIASIDAAARQPQRPFEQDRLKDQRRHAHDRRFALRCG
jgi:hypothetical protein